jgi:hypothetical protein
MRTFILRALIVLFGPIILVAQIPQTITYQGILTDAGGTTVTDGSYMMIFRLYTSDSETTVLWSESQEVVVINGIFNVLLGRETPLDLPFDTAYWLGVTVGDGPELAPRIQLSSSAYSFRARTVDDGAVQSISIADGAVTGSKLADGAIIAGARVVVTRNVDNNLVISAEVPDGGLPEVTTDGTLSGKGTPGEPLSLADDAVTVAKIADGAVTKAKLSASGGSDGQVLKLSSGALAWENDNSGEFTLPYTGTTATTQTAFSLTTTGTGRAAIFRINNGTNDNAVLYGETTGRGRVGHFRIVNVDNVNASVSASTTGSGAALSGYTTGSGAGVHGRTDGSGHAGRFEITNAANSNDVLYVTTSGTGRTIHAIAESNTAIWGRTTTGFAGVDGRSNSGYGLHGLSESNYGIYGKSNTVHGVYGEATATSGLACGGFFMSNSLIGRGVVGTVNAASGTNWGGYFISASTAGVGVLGYTTAASGTNYGVHGITNSPSGYAGFFDGRVHVTGNLSKGGGSFEIDHPLDPANKILRHSFVESPDMMNVYNGIIRTDGNGYAAVVLPDYFESLNMDFRYQLTVIGDFAQAIISEKINGNRFFIRTDKPNVEVSWQVTGVRKDPWAEKNRIIIEEYKKPEFRGYYLHPQPYGQPETRSVQWIVNPEMMKMMQEERNRHESEYQPGNE